MCGSLRKKKRRRYFRVQHRGMERLFLPHPSVMLGLVRGETVLKLSARLYEQREYGLNQ